MWKDSLLAVNENNNNRRCLADPPMTVTVASNRKEKFLVEGGDRLAQMVPYRGDSLEPGRQHD